MSKATKNIKLPSTLKQEPKEFESPLFQYIEKVCKSNRCRNWQSGCSLGGVEGLARMQLCMDAAILAAFNEPLPATDPKQIVEEAAAFLPDLFKSLSDKEQTPDEFPEPIGLGLRKD